MQLITLKKFNIQTCFSQFLWFFTLKCWFKGQIISRIQLNILNAYKMMCFDRNINGNRDVEFLECDYLLMQRCVKLTLTWVVFLLPANKFDYGNCKMLLLGIIWLIKNEGISHKNWRCIKIIVSSEKISPQCAVWCGIMHT